MKILHVLDHSVPLHSGYSFRSEAILDSQHRNGYLTCQVTSGKHYASDDREERIGTRKYYRTKRRKGLLSKAPLVNQLIIVWDLYWRIRDVAGRENPDLIHAHSPCLNGLSAMWAAARLRIPLVYEMRASWEDAAVSHGTTREGSLRYRLARGLETYVLKSASSIVGICQGLEREIRSRTGSSAQIFVVGNGVPREELARPMCKTRDSPKAAIAETTLGFAGSFYEYEGLDLLIGAIGTLIKRGIEVRLILAGGGPQDSRLKRQVEHAGLGKHVMFLGRVDHDAVRGVYEKADIMVYPRKKSKLTDMVTPLKPLEAMAAGRLVVASDVGGHQELIEDGKTGFLFEADSAEAIANKLEEVISKKEKWWRMIDNARAYVEVEHGWDQLSQRYDEVYRRAVARGWPKRWSAFGRKNARLA